MITALFTQLEGHGGVQRLARQQLRALVRWAEKRGVPWRAFSLVDVAGPGEIVHGGEWLVYTGAGGSRPGLLRRAAPAALRSGAVYTNHLFLAPAAAALRLARPGLRYGVHLHGIEVWHPLPGLRQRALEGAALVTASSRDTARQAARFSRLRRSRVQVLYPALDPKIAEGALAEEGAPPRLLFVGRLNTEDREKHLHSALEVFARLAPDRPGWRFRIVGPGDAEPFRTLAERLGIGDRVDFLGAVPDEDLQREYASCQIFLMPSLKEGFGIVFLEAMAHGRAVVGGSSGGTPEIIRDGRTGLLVEPTNPGAFAEKLASVMDDGELRERLGRAGRRRLDQRFLPEHFEVRFCAAMRRLMPEAGP